jgi:beta-lactamase regulating signal transducer with metallopeptidase domain
MSAERTVELALSQLVQLTLAIVVASALTWLFCRRGPHLAYAIWVLVLAKSLTPPIWSSPLGVFSWAASRQAVAVAPVHVVDTLAPASLNLATPSLHLTPLTIAWDWSELALAIWIAGGVVLLVGVGIRSWRFRRRIDRCSVAPPAELKESIDSLCPTLGLNRRLSLRLCAEPVGPAVFGVLRPVVIMPVSLLQENSSEQLRTIVAHEIIHVRRRDSLIACAQLLSQAVWWFNPLVWWMNRQINQTREICCDAEVVATLPCPAAEYAQTLIDVLRQHRSLRLSSAAMGIQPVTQERIERIMENATQTNGRMLRRYWAMTALVALLLLPGAGILSASEPPAADAVGTIVEVTHFVRVVVDADVVRLQGQRVKLEELPAALGAVPDRSHTVLEIAYASDDVTMGEYMKVFSAIANDSTRGLLGFKYLSQIGKQSADSKGSDDERVFAALTPAPISDLTHVLPFQVGHTEFNDKGDGLTITEIRSDRDKFEVGGTYQVRGTFHLSSRDHVRLALWVSATRPGEGRGFGAPGQFMAINKGDGTFTLTDRFPVVGYPHINLDTDDGGAGTMYFGSGDWLLSR